MLSDPRLELEYHHSSVGEHAKLPRLDAGATRVSMKAFISGQHILPVSRLSKCSMLQ